MRKHILVLVAIGLFATSCMNPLMYLYSGIAPGYIGRYNYGVSKEVVQYAVNQFTEQNPQYKLPDSLRAFYYDEGFKPNRELYIYFKDEPIEVYWVEYGGGEQYWKEHPNESTLYLQGVGKPNKPFRRYDRLKLWFRGRKRIQKRFETEVLSKLHYAYVKEKK